VNEIDKLKEDVRLLKIKVKELENNQRVLNKAQVETINVVNVERLKPVEDWLRVGKLQPR